MSAEKTVSGLLTLAFGGLALAHFVLKFLRRRKVTSLAIASLCACVLLGVLPLHERLPPEVVGALRWMYAGTVSFLWWSIRRVDVVEDALEARRKARGELEKWYREHPQWRRQEAPSDDEG